MEITTAETFQIELRGKMLEVSESRFDLQRIFHIRFPEGPKTLVLTVGESKEGGKFWTSVPPNRLAEASEIGPLIAHYFKDKKNS